MRTGLLFAILGLLLLVLLLSRGGMQLTASTVDIHLFDTYFVMTYFHFVLLFMMVLGSFFSIGAVVGTRFRNAYFLGMLLLFVLADTFMIWKMKDLFW
jgi:heme/copper-type cytochrome/quinol oxidase subunit 1